MNLKCLNENFITVSQFAKRKGCSAQYIRKVIKDGRLLCGKVGKQWVIPVNEKINGEKS